MLNKPNINELMECVDSKYVLAVVAAKRARNMIDANPELSATVGVNPVSIALNEVVEDKLVWGDQATIEAAEAAATEEKPEKE